MNRFPKWTLALSVVLAAAFVGVAVRSLVFARWGLVLLAPVVAVALFVAYRLEAAERAYARGRYGLGRRVVSEPTTLDGSGCVDCGRSDGQGVRRQFVREAVVDGVAVAVVEHGANDYCADCAADEPDGKNPAENFEKYTGNLRSERKR